MIDREKEKMEFEQSVERDAIKRYFEVMTEKRELQNKIVELEIEKDKAVSKARLDMAKTIFKDMYDLVSGERDETIIVTASDVKSVAKRYGVKL